jgi:hypothetical protein
MSVIVDLIIIPDRRVHNENFQNTGPSFSITLATPAISLPINLTLDLEISVLIDFVRFAEKYLLVGEAQVYYIAYLSSINRDRIIIAV